MITKISTRNLRFDRGYYYAALLYAFLIPFDQKLVTIALLLWALFSLLNFRKSELHKNKYLLLLPLLYLSYAIGLFTSTIPSFTFLEYKLSLLAFPFIFLLHNYSETDRKNMLRTIIYGLLLAAIVCLIGAVFRSFLKAEGALIFRANLEEGRGFFESVIFGGNQFFGQHFSLFHQTVYSALYLCTGVAVLIFNKNIFSVKFNSILVTFFTLVIFLISNKAGIVVICCIFLIRILTARYTKIKKAAALGLLTFLTLALAFTNPRLRESISKLSRGEISLDKEARYDYKTRLLSWDAALELIRQNPFLGYGLGGTQKELNKVYSKKGYSVPLSQNFNAHNVFMQLWLENGIFGLLLLILIFVVLLRKALGNKRHLGFVLSVFTIFFINGLFESFFSRFSGISFFAFLICFIYTQTNSIENKIEN